MEYMPREQNARVDLLSKLANTRIVVNNMSIIQEVINEQSISGGIPPRYMLHGIGAELAITHHGIFNHWKTT